MSRGVLAAYLLGLSALWGGAFPLVRYVVQTMPPLALTTVRAGIAAVALGVFLVVGRQGGRLDWAAVRVIVLLALGNAFLPNVLMAAALGRITSAQGALIQACGPLMVGALAAAFLDEAALTRRRLAGMALGVAGVGVIFAPLALAGDGSILGGLLMLGTTVCYAVSTIYIRWARPGATALVSCGQQVAACGMAGALSLGLYPAEAFVQGASVWVALLVLGVLGSAVPFTLYLRMLRTASASEAAMIGYLQPVWATAIAAALLGEWPEMRVFVGGATVLAGVYLASASASSR